MTDPEIQLAESQKYLAQRVLALPSGRFAVFDVFSNETGLPRLFIGEWADCRSFITIPTPRAERLPPPPLSLEDLGL